jgi:hypothetical protein
MAHYLHNFDHTFLKLVKSVTNASKLDALESIVMQHDMSGKLMNLDIGPLESFTVLLFFFAFLIKATWSFTVLADFIVV